MLSRDTVIRCSTISDHGTMRHRNQQVLVGGWEMRASHLLGLLLVLLTLAGCSAKESDANAHAAQFAADEATCTGYGFKKDTPEFANCLMELDQTHKGYGIAPQP